MLTGEHVGLRAIEPDDLEALRGWRNQPAFRRCFREYREIGPDQQRHWYETQVIGSAQTLMFAIEDLTDGRLLGASGLCLIDWVNRNCDLSIYIGADDVYIDDRYAPDAARVTMRYGFETLGMHRIWTEIYAYDDTKRRMLEALGFQLEGRHRQHHFEDGGWHDSLFYGMLSDEFAA